MKTGQFIQTTAPVAGFDHGLRAYMLMIYNYMAGALFLTGLVAFYAAHSTTFLQSIYVMQGGAITGLQPLAWVVMFAPLGLVILLSFGSQGMSLLAAEIVYWAYAVLMGLSLSSIFLTFTGTSVARVFFIAACMFGGMSLYGYNARRNLGGVGLFMFMGLTGLIIASLMNMFLLSSALQFTVSVIGVLVFTGLTAYDTQKLKQLYYQLSVGGERAGKIAIMGALTLYLDFINIFLNFLYLFGDRKK